MRHIILALALLICAPAHADTWITASVTSFHQERNRYNEFNPGLGFEYGSETLRFIGGGYRNSLYRNTLYVGVQYTPLRFGRFAIGGIGAIVTGYSDKPVPVPVPLVAYEGQKYGLNVVVLPPIEDKKGVLGFQVKAKF